MYAVKKQSGSPEKVVFILFCYVSALIIPENWKNNLGHLKAKQLSSYDYLRNFIYLFKDGNLWDRLQREADLDSLVGL